MRFAVFMPGVVLSVAVAACGDNTSSRPDFGFGASTGITTGIGGTTTTGGGPFGGFDQPVIVPARPTPALSGGTLLLIAKGHTAAVADPERDRLHFVDLDQLKVTATVLFAKGDEPGRLAEDNRGRVHVVLRGGGAVATLDPGSGM